MQALIVGEVSVEVLEDVLGDAELLASSPQPPERIEDMINLLRNAIAQQSTQ